MKMKLVRHTKWASLLLIMVLIIAGCSSNSGGNTTNNASPKPENSPVATENSTNNGDGDGDGASSGLSGNVVFWSMWSESEPQAKVIQSAVEAFKAANTNVTVDLKFTGRDLSKLIKPALDGGEKVDIFEGDPQVSIGILKDHVLKLDSFLEQPALEMDGKTVGESILPSLMNWTTSLSAPAGLEAGAYAIPQQPFAVLMFYNKEVYDKAGITAPPTTWEEFMDINDKIKASGVDPVTFDDAYRDLFIGAYLSSAMGNEWVDQLVNDKTGEMWKEPIVQQFANDIATMQQKGHFSKKIAGSKYPAAQQDLVLGQSAAYLNGSWLPNEVSETAGPDFEWGSYQFPLVSNGNGKGGHDELNFGAQSVMLNAKSDNQEAAFELVKYLISKSVQEQMVAEAQAIPATIDTAWPATLAEAQVAIERAKINAPWGYGINNNEDFSKGTIIPIFMELVEGKLTPEQYVEKMSGQAKKFYSAGN
ncbi:ABC transporter substrate-binding protein [Paenibacillus yanchengensis]|uniref:ABC transporter substrate-binding protein n=1 Tax=Paenibacillus yanchengensis TaxID=2035833 RepID=A0ABW4YFT3_9BACL